METTASAGRPRPPVPPPPPPRPSEMEGPYDAGNGTCPYGHPVNGYGRCEPLNSVPEGQTRPPGCPLQQERVSELMNLPVTSVVNYATVLGIVIPPLLTGETLRAALVPLIMAVEYP